VAFVRAGHPEAPVTPVARPPLLRREGADGLIVPPEVAAGVGLKTAPVRVPTRPRALPHFHGVLALDNSALARVRSRFAGEVVSIGSTEVNPDPLSGSPVTTTRPLRAGDHVEKGHLLAVIWSKDLGEKKSELADAVSKLKVDEVTLRQLEGLLREGATADRSVREAERNVQADRVAVERAERTLRSWRLTDAELAAIRAEADASAHAGAADWARVEVRAPLAGTILERNLAVGDMVDTTSDLFKIGDLTSLAVWAHVYEDDLPLLQGLPRPMHWTVEVPSRPGERRAGTLESVGEVIDPNQHTALVTGRVENSDGLLKVGQFVTVSVELPPPAGQVELPAEAVIEDGRHSIVFVRPDPSSERYIRKDLRVVRRFRDVVYAAAEPGGVRPGDEVVTSGAILLRDALETLPKSE
jgi:cobalt-zinc-cadmium efflux system membrane fusion protein